MQRLCMTENQSTVALFDLDGTLTWRDTLIPFLCGYLIRHPLRVLQLWKLPPALAAFFFLDHDRGRLKSQIIRAVMGNERRATIAAWADAFVDGLRSRGAFRAAALNALDAHRAAGHHLVLLSASPDLYVPRIGQLLGFERTLCTELAWAGERLDGHLVTPNRQGEEKLHCLKWLRTQYPGMPIIAYGNSATELGHLRQADRAILVNGGMSARRLASEVGITTADWL